LLAPALLAVVSVLPLGGCITQPQDSHGNRAEAHVLLGVEPGSGELPDITRNTGMNAHYQRMLLPNGKYGMVLCSMDMVFIPQAVIDNLDAETRLAWFKALGYAAGAFADAGTGAHYFGFTKTREKHEVDLSGGLNNTNKIGKTDRWVPFHTPVPDPE